MPGLDGMKANLRRLEPTAAEKNLGVMMAPQDDGSSHRSLLTKRAKAWAQQIRPSRLLPYDVLPLLRTTIFKTLECSMALKTLHFEVWTKQLWPVLMVVLPKAKVSRHFPRVVVYAPLRYQGLGIPHPYGLQLTHHLDILLRHPANWTSTFSYLETNLQAHQLETGTSFPLFQQDFPSTATLVSDT